jgi:hypothetical protein
VSSNTNESFLFSGVKQVRRVPVQMWASLGADVGMQWGRLGYLNPRVLCSTLALAGVRYAKALRRICCCTFAQGMTHVGPWATKHISYWVVPIVAGHVTYPAIKVGHCLPLKPVSPFITT